MSGRGSADLPDRGAIEKDLRYSTATTKVVFVDQAMRTLALANVDKLNNAGHSFSST